MKDDKIKKSRKQRSKHEYKLGKYLILTDTKETESNYFEGIKNNLPAELREQLLIRIIPNAAEMWELTDKALEIASGESDYTDIWLVFDYDGRDRIDEVVVQAEKKNLHVAWSNPCLEIWFFAYFGSMPTFSSHVQCCDVFKEKFEKITGQKYVKSGNDIYLKLKQYGDEVKAISLAKTRCRNYSGGKPSKMISCSKVYELVEQIVDCQRTHGER